MGLSTRPSPTWQIGDMPKTGQCLSSPAFDRTTPECVIDPATQRKVMSPCIGSKGW